MAAVTLNEYKRRLGVPSVLMLLSFLALLVALSGLVRTTSISAERMADLNVSWQAVQDGEVEGSELLATDRNMQRALVPVPAVVSAARWSLALALLTLALLAWVIVLARRVGRTHVADETGREQNEQAAVLKLMDEIAPLASGDLRVRATVTDSNTGSLADAFNYAVSELRWLVGTMNGVAAQINESIERSRETAKTVAQACAEQSEEIHRSSNYLLNMSGAMAELSAYASDSSVAAQAAVEQAGNGAKALEASLNRFSAVRDEADSTTRLMHRLAENVSAIEERISMIEDVARQTDLLALNTTIKASTGTTATSAPESSSDLGRLSDEVAQLAEVLGQSTRDIGSLTRSIAQDAKDTVRSMEHTNAELAIGLEQTSAATAALQGILHDSLSLKERIVNMATQSVEQSGVVRQLSGNMDTINRITGQTADGVSASADSLDEFQELARELRQSLADFKLPETPAAGTWPDSVTRGYDTGSDLPSGNSSDKPNDKPSLARRAADRAVIHD